MAFIPYHDRVQETSTTNNTSVWTVNGALDASYYPFSQYMSVGDTCIGGVIEDGAAFASGLLTYSAANQITLSTIFESKGTFGAGSKHIFMSLPGSMANVRTFPQGRLTLTTGVPVLTSDVTAATTIYYTPDMGDLVPIYNGARFAPTEVPELSLALDSNNLHTGYHQSGKNFDLFVINDAGTLRLASGLAWTNDTTRNETLSRINGILVSDASIVLRFGSASGNTVTYTNRATYVGTFRASADGQTQMKFGSTAAGGGEAWFGLWNMYNRRKMGARVADSNTWSYATSAWRAADNSTTFRISMVRGQDEDAVSASYGVAITPAVASAYTLLGFGLDSTTALANAASQSIGYSVIASPITRFEGLPGLGFHYLQAIEQGDGTNTNAMSGANYSLLGASMMA